VCNNSRFDAVQRTLEGLLSRAVNHSLANLAAIGCPGDEAHGVTLSAIVLRPSEIKHTESTLGLWQLACELLPRGVNAVILAFLTGTLQGNALGAVNLFNLKNNVLNLRATQLLVALAGFVSGLDSGLERERKEGGKEKKEEGKEKKE
jgi:hypothetical protein